MKTSSLLVLAASLGLASTASAQVLMLDFGPTTATGTDRLNSPYHTAANSFADTTWNTIGNTTPTTDPSSLLFSDGSAAVYGSTSVTANFGSVTNSSTINLSTQPTSSNALGGGTNSGVYLNTSVGKDAIFSGSNGTNTRVGMQVTGLAAGTYDVYVIARNTNTGNNQAAYSQTVYLGAGAANSNFDYAATVNTVPVYSSSTLTYPTGQGSASIYTSAWVNGENYVKFSVSLTAGQALNIAVAGSGGDTRGFLNAVQIVNTTAIPEPSAFAALAGLGVLGLAATRRRRSARG